MSDKRGPDLFRPTIQKTSTLVLMALAGLLCYSAAVLSKVLIISDSYETKLEAAHQMQAAMEHLKSGRMEAGIFMDPENDPNETGLVGTQFSLITTDEGDLDSKLTTLDPNFAAAIVELFTRADLTAGDTIAVLFTGSMPGGNMAVLIACDVMDIHPVVITSLGASQWGANLPDFTWLDMERILFEEGYSNSRSIAASIGGRNDMGRLLSPSGRQMLLDNVTSHGIEVIREDSLGASVNRRMVLLGSTLSIQRYSAFVNVGGGVASLGTSFNHKLLPPGVVRRRDVESITRSGGIDGTLVHFARQNIPVVHILNIQALTGQLGMPYAPIPLPEIGRGDLYAEQRYNLLVTTICLIIVVGMVAYIGYRSHQQIKARMEQHEPDSVI